MARAVHTACLSNLGIDTTLNPQRPSRQYDPVERLSVFLLGAMHLCCLLVFVMPFSWSLVALCAGSYALRMWAITAGYHRYFSHRSYKTSRFFQFLLGLLGTSAMQNGPLWWASWHRRHHRDSDTVEDPHSPRQHGFWQAHIGWILCGRYDNPDLSNVADMSRFPELRFLDKHKWLPLIAYALGCYAIAGWSGVVWGFVLSSVLLLHATAAINSLAHVWGSRRYATPDDSRNNPWLAVVTLGEGWHNNHHHGQGYARQGFFWWEIDVSYYVLKLLSWAGIVWDLRVPSPKVLGSSLVLPVGPVGPVALQPR
jgi:stearoyl-CoA desaturase (delta-9 desaturase)